MSKQSHRWVMRIVEIETGKVVEETAPTDENAANQMVTGALWFIDRERFATVAADLDEETAGGRAHA